jgi:predicted CoA-substrate-specific enzyme activase
MEKTKKGYLGIDCGSVGVKLALIDEESKIIDVKYLRNRGIMETLKKGLENIANDNYEIRGVGVTGSGRELASYLVGADIVKTEILAHTIATLNFYPNVRTILDIGGEDCKIMKIKEGVLEDFTMNAICGAGTGSVIDSIATRMGINIEDVGDLALESKERLDFPGKCGVFTQSSVVSHLNSGYNKSDILMGVTRALVNNYLMLGKGKELNPPYVYQGATSQNKAIVRALEEQLKSEIIVPKYSPEMGAIGIGLMAKEKNIERSNFKGYYLAERNYNIKNKKSRRCDNMCTVNMIYDGKKFIGSTGNRCDKCVPKIE